MNLSLVHRYRWHIIVSILMLALVMGMLPLLGYATQAAGSPTHPVVHKVKHFKFAKAGTKPPTDAQCRAANHSPCYSPQEIRKAYGVTPLINAGYTGKGQSIVIIDSFGSPTISQDLKTFDAGYGLPDPPSLKVVAPLGTIAFDPNNADMVGWAEETSIDVEWAHALAPDANIVLMTSPVSETQGVQGMPEFLFLEKYAVQHHLGNIVSQSWGTTEETLFTPGGRQILNQFNSFYRDAGTQGVTFFASSGDAGVANPNVNGQIYPFPTVGFPASSPYVTAVGGTTLFATTNGTYQKEVVWNGGQPNGGATGGGVSHYFAEPDYQKNNLPASVQAVLNGHRGLPDIAYDADPATGILIYASFQPLTPGYYQFGGTSIGSPQWAGIIADGNQLAGHSLGFINPALYKVGNSSDYSESYHDITVGNNTQNGIKGFSAKPGWDLTTGWGSPIAATLLQELIERTGH